MSTQVIIVESIYSKRRENRVLTWETNEREVLREFEAERRERKIRRITERRECRGEMISGRTGTQSSKIT